MAEINKVGNGLPPVRLRQNANVKSSGSPAAGSADQAASPAIDDVHSHLRNSDGFDAVKVEQISNAIRNGQYPIDSKRIAQNFLQLESLLADTVKRA